MTFSEYFEKYFKPADERYDAGERAEAIAMLEPAFEEFPEQYYDIASYIMMCYRELEQYDKCLQIIASAVKQGYFFSLSWEGWDPLREIEGSQVILAENERLGAEAKKDAKMRYEVHLPEGYTPEVRCPLFLSMHCDSGSMGNIEWHRQYWRPETMLAHGFIVAYLQSSQLIGSGGAAWSGDAEQRRADIRQCYEAVAAEYAVDDGKTIVSGFSGGAMAAIDAALNDIIPARGFIALGPDKPEEFSREICENARQRGVRGVILEGELVGDSPGDTPDIREMAAVFNEVGLPYELVINAGIGHWYPDDLPEKLDRAIHFIVEMA